MMVLVWGLIAPPPDGVHHLMGLSPSNFVGKAIYVTMLLTIMALCGSVQLSGACGSLCRFAEVESDEHGGHDHDHGHGGHGNDGHGPVVHDHGGSSSRDTDDSLLGTQHGVVPRMLFIFQRSRCLLSKITERGNGLMPLVFLAQSFAKVDAGRVTRDLDRFWGMRHVVKPSTLPRSSPREG